MKKIISLFTMVAFIIFSLSCTTTKNVRLDADSVKENGKIKILQVVKKSGETIEFSKKQPGIIYKDAIIGTAVRVTEEISVDQENIEGIKSDKKGKVYEITTKDGKKYQVDLGAAKEIEDKYIFTVVLESSVDVSIPFSEVEQVLIKESKGGSTALIFFGSIVGLVLLGLWIMIPKT